MEIAITKVFHYYDQLLLNFDLGSCNYKKDSKNIISITWKFDIFQLGLNIPNYTKGRISNQE